MISIRLLIAPFAVSAALLVAGAVDTTHSSLGGTGSDLDPTQTVKPEDLANEDYDCIIARIRFASYMGGGDFWQAYPAAEMNLLNEFNRIVKSKTKPIVGASVWKPHDAADGQLNAVVSLDEPERLRRYPFLLVTSETRYTLTDDEIKNLRNYVKQGGFIFMDDCMAMVPGADHFYQSSLIILEKAFGKGCVVQVPSTHEIFNNVFDLSKIGLPFMNGKRRGAYGVFIGNRLAVVLSSHDLHCGWCDEFRAQYTPQPNVASPDGSNTYDDAIRFGINMLVYALTH